MRLLPLRHFLQIFASVRWSQKAVIVSLQDHDPCQIDRKYEQETKQGTEIKCARKALCARRCQYSDTSISESGLWLFFRRTFAGVARPPGLGDRCPGRLPRLGEPSRSLGPAGYTFGDFTGLTSVTAGDRGPLPFPDLRLLPRGPRFMGDPPAPSGIPLKSGTGPVFRSVDAALRPRTGA